MPAGPFVELEVGDRTVRISNPDKVYFAARGETKLDLVRYYLSVEDGVLRALRERPTVLQRHPDGAGTPAIYQKRVPDSRPPWLQTVLVRFPSGREAAELCVTELAALAWAVNLGTVTFHPWPSRRSDVEHPDELRIDLDPQPPTSWPDAVAVALSLRELLAEVGLTGWPKTSGNKGVHVLVRLGPGYSFLACRRAVLALGRELERRRPDLVTTAWWREERGAKVFVDYNRMARDQTVAASYSVRARPDATVSAPLRWAELAEAEPEDFTIATVPARFALVGDPHDGIDGPPGALDPVLEMV
ncbi:MAG: non-homologous end-joining DNA ligase, partial [Mycobacteriales bacterium]